MAPRHIASSRTSVKTTAGLSVPSDPIDGNLGTRSMSVEHQFNKERYVKKAVDPVYEMGYSASYTEVYSKNGVPTLKSVTYMTRDGEFRTISDVPYVHERGSSYNGVPSTVLVKETNPIKAANGDPSAVYAYAPKDTIAIVNQCLPAEVKIKSGTDNFGKSGSDPCWAEKFFHNSKEYMEAQARGMAGDISDRTDILIQQGKTKRSPSMIIDEESGALYLADSTGLQSFKMANGATTHRSADVDTGLATRSRNIVMQENPVVDTMPTSTILTPQPVLIPHFAKLSNTVLSIMDFIDLIDALSAAVQLFTSEKNEDSEGAQEAREKINSEATHLTNDM